MSPNNCQFCGQLFLLVAASTFTVLYAFTHWVVTDEGKIVATTESLHDMMQPHDLVQFLRQDERVEKLNKAQERLNSQQDIIKESENSDEPNVEQRLMQTDADCLAAVIPLSQHNLFASTAIKLEQFGIRLQDVVESVESSANGERLQPFCDNTPLPFSMSAFEHLKSIQNRQSLKLRPESRLLAYIRPHWKDVEEFGDVVAKALAKIYDLATIYWRLQGNAGAAIECIRRSLDHSDIIHRPIALLNLANVLHVSGNSENAVTVVEAALAVNNSISDLCFTAACIYAITLQYNRSISLFDRLLELDPDYPNAAAVRAAVKCHSKLEAALEAQHSNLQRTLTQLQSYQVRLKNFHKLHEQVSRHTADAEAKLSATLAYDYFMFGPIKGSQCEWTDDNGERYLECEIEDREAYEQDKFRKQLEESSEYLLLRSLGIKVSSDGKTPADAEVEQQFLQAILLRKGLYSLTQPTLQRKYLPEMYQSSDLSSVFLPTEIKSCAAAPALNSVTVPTLILPETKGFSSELLLNGYLNLNSTVKHPLPWYPPYCGIVMGGGHSKDFHVACCDHLLSVQRIKNREKEQLLPEPHLKQVLLGLAKSESIEEVGQRLNTLLKYDIGPRWLVLSLAAIYWRMVGDVSEASLCLRLALNEDASRAYADVALAQLSYLSYSIGGRLDDAIMLAKQGLEVDEYEPVNHLLLGYFYALKEDYVPAVFHVRRAMIIEPATEGVEDLLSAVRCKAQESLNQAKAAESSAQKSKMCPDVELMDMPKFFCLRDENGERCYLEERMVPGADMSSAAQDDNCPSSSATTGSGKCTTENNNNALSSTSELEHATNSHKSAKTRDSKASAADPNSFSPDAAPAVNEASAINENDEQAELSLFDNTIEHLAAPRPQIVPPKDHRNSHTIEYYAPHLDKGLLLDPDMLKKGDNGVESDPRSSAGTIGGVHMRVSKELGKKPVLEIVATTGFEPTPSPLPSSSIPSFDNDLAVPPDIEFPDIVPTPPQQMVAAGKELHSNQPATSSAECAHWKNKVKLEQATSTWLSVSAKGISVMNYVLSDVVIPDTFNQEPFCPTDRLGGIWTLDHLNGFAYRSELAKYKPEKGLKDAFESLGGVRRESVEQMARRLAFLMNNQDSTVLQLPENSQHLKDESHKLSWVYAALAALYWRVRGNATAAIECLRYSLNYAPLQHRDLTLVSLANVYQQSGMLNSALIAAGAALDVSPKFVVVHFTLANIYAAMDELDRAAEFYYSTLSLQKSFEPAKERLWTIFCVRADQTSTASTQTEETPDQMKTSVA